MFRYAKYLICYLKLSLDFLMRDAKNKLNCEVNDDCCLEMMSYEVRNGVYEKHRRSEQKK